MDAAPALTPSRAWREIEPLRSLLDWLRASALGLCALILIAGLLAWLVPLAWTGGGSYEVPGVWFVGTLVLGIPLVVMYGAPAYAILARLGRARWSWLVALGVAPAIVFFAHSPLIGAVAIASGAALTHLLQLALQRVLRAA